MHPQLLLLLAVLREAGGRAGLGGNGRTAPPRRLSVRTRTGGGAGLEGCGGPRVCSVQGKRSG